MPIKFPIYLDHHATTLVDPRVAEVMIPYLSEHFGNAASGTHAFGWRAAEAVNLARECVATLLHAADPKEIVWTSGTTESDNLTSPMCPVAGSLPPEVETKVKEVEGVTSVKVEVV